MTEREINLTDAALRERFVQTFFAAFQSEASALVHHKILSREECSSLVSTFARIAADHAIALRDAARREQAERRAGRDAMTGREIAEMIEYHLGPARDSEDALARERLARAVVERERQGCLCLHIEPCDPRCTCRNRFSSYGCTRCCSYGSAEQQRATAREVADRDARLARAMQLAEAFATCHHREEHHGVGSFMECSTTCCREARAALADAGTGGWDLAMSKALAPRKETQP